MPVWQIQLFCERKVTIFISINILSFKNNIMKDCPSEISPNVKGKPKSSYLLPKLKSYSQNNVSIYGHQQFKNGVKSVYDMAHYKSNQLNTAQTTLDKAKSNAQYIKYQYINKSPNYFKKKNRASQLTRLDQFSYNQPVQNYLQQKKKDFDRKALINLVNNRIKNISLSNRKFITAPQPSEKDDQLIPAQEKLLGSRSNLDKLKTYVMSQKPSLLKQQNIKPKPCNSEINHEKKKRTQWKKRNKLATDLSEQNKYILLQEPQQIQRKAKQFKQTKYSSFQPNKIQGVKNLIQNIKKHPSLKLNSQYY